ncbi:unnamed protein product [Orchesella dallaii]|uniref:RING-type domain-containing protein n=1 Tax=Orchesella dallaii TaxID=48710 RepID=A0ABP1RRE3_9HEXA
MTSDFYGSCHQEELVFDLMEGTVESAGTIQDLIFTSNKHNIILTELSEDAIDDYRCWDFPWSSEDDWQWENVDGPECFLCGKEAMADQQLMKYGGEMYRVIFKKHPPPRMILSSSGSDSFLRTISNERKGFLQCAYCFNSFHRQKCILSLSDKKYYEFKCSNEWICPSCIPEFRCKTDIILEQTDTETNFDFDIKFLLRFLKAFYHLYNFLGQSPFYGIFELFLCLQGFFKAIIWLIDVG